MSIKYTLQGLLIYSTFVCFLLTILFRRRVKLSRIFWFAGFLAACVSLIWRGIHTGHPPMQNLFEFFLCMAVVFWPLSQWNRWKNGLDTQLSDAALGVLILFPAGFVFDESVRMLPPALKSPIFVPHVGSYVAAYVLLARATILAFPFWKATDNIRFDSALLQRRADAVHQTVACGFFLMTLGLLLGSIWGQLCWGHYWAWDPKEMWSLATWMIYAAYFHYHLQHGVTRPRRIFLLLATGLLFIILTLTWINVSRLFTGMHSYA